MRKFTSLPEYLDGLKTCHDPHELKEEYRIYDNWIVLLYGDQEDIFSKVTAAFRGQDLGQEWYPEFSDHETIYFHNTKARAQVNKKVYQLYTEEDADKIDGQDHSAWAMFHSYKTSMGNLDNYDLIARAIVPFGEYIIRQKLTARFPLPGLEFNYIP